MNETALIAFITDNEITLIKKAKSYSALMLVYLSKL